MEDDENADIEEDESNGEEDDEEEDDEEDDVIQLPHLIRSYVESNEEMTESDCNVHEVDDDERTG